MKINKKIISILAPIATVGAIAPIASSCILSEIGAGGDTKKEEKKSPTARTLNMSNTTAMNDINNDLTPFCILNPETYGEAGVTVVWKHDSSSTLKIQYQTGKYYGSYISWDTETGWQDVETEEESSWVQSFTISHTQTIRFRAYHTSASDVGKFSTSDNRIQIRMDSGNVTLGGSLLSLLCTNTTAEGTWESDLELKSDYVFDQLFSYSYAIHEVGINLLPFTKLTKHCYQNMFEHCDNIRSAPALPATTLTEGCYLNMFYNCYDLQVAPHLPATHLANYCYANMFYYCRDLKSLSLGYVGNFIEDSGYFSNWIFGACTQDTGTIYYNGLDTEVSSSALPEGFTVLKNQTVIDNNTIDIQFKNDSALGTQTSILTSTDTNKNKVRVYKTDTLADTRLCMPPVQCKTGGTADPVYRDADGNILTETELVTTLSPNDIYLSYYKQPTEVNAKAVNIISEYTADEEAAGKKTTFKATLASGAWLQYYDEENTKWVSYTSGTTKELTHGQNLQIRGNINTSSSAYTNIVITGKAALKGSAMSLLITDESEYTIPTTLNNYAFYMLFYGSTGITSIAENFLLPPDKSVGDVLELKLLCYAAMFWGCSNLTNAPYIPMGTDISSANGCCARMFYECTSLKEAPALPATTLPSSYVATNTVCGVYESMFYKCSSLTKACDLPATTIPFASYRYMFEDCTSLTFADEDGKFNGPTISAQDLSADGVAIKDGSYAGCMIGMFYGCSGLIYTPKIPNIGASGTAKIGKYAMYQMFYGCTSLKYADGIVFTENKSLKLSQYCLAQMFYNCKALKTAPNMLGIATSQNGGGGGGFKPQSESTRYCYQMFYNCSSLTVDTTASGGVKFFVCFSSSSTDDVGSMFNGTTPTSGNTYYYHA